MDLASSRVVFHVGMPKTGTTSIQHAFSELAQDGRIRYPCSPNAVDQFQAMRGLLVECGQVAECSPTESVWKLDWRIWEQMLVPDAQGRGIPTVISAESLMLANADSLAALLARLGYQGSKCTIALSLRDPRSQIVALYAQSLRSWDCPSFSTWVRTIERLDSDIPLGSPLPSAFNPHRDVGLFPLRNSLASHAISEWKKNSRGWDFVSVPFDARGPNLVDTFLDACGIQRGTARSAPVRRNVGLTACQIYALCQVRTRQRPRADYWNAGGRLLARLAGQECSGSCTWSPEVDTEARLARVQVRETARLQSLNCELASGGSPRPEPYPATHEGAIPGTGYFHLCSRHDELDRLARVAIAGEPLLDAAGRIRRRGALAKRKRLLRRVGSEE